MKNLVIKSSKLHSEVLDAVILHQCTCIEALRIDQCCTNQTKSVTDSIYNLTYNL